mgnify:CR=1 FL=1
MSRVLTREQYDWAVARVEELLPLVDEDTPTSDPASIELEILSNLVADYSDENFAIGDPDLASVMREHMHEQGLSQKELAEKLGVSPSRVSEYLIRGFSWSGSVVVAYYLILQIRLIELIWVTVIYP